MRLANAPYRHDGDFTIPSWLGDLEGEGIADSTPADGVDEDAVIPDTESESDDADFHDGLTLSSSSWVNELYEEDRPSAPSPAPEAAPSAVAEVTLLREEIARLRAQLLDAQRENDALRAAAASAGCCPAQPLPAPADSAGRYARWAALNGVVSGQASSAVPALSLEGFATTATFQQPLPPSRLPRRPAQRASPSPWAHEAAAFTGIPSRPARRSA